MKLKLLMATTCLAMMCAVAASATTITYNEGTQSVYAEQTAMLAVNPGDHITIEVSGAGSDLTLLSYKEGETPGSDNIQYVNQYSSEDGTYSIDYVVRDIAGAKYYGVYRLAINDGTSGEVKNVYYKVGAPELTDENGETTTTYFKRVNFGEQGDADLAGANTTSVAYMSKFNVKGNISEYGFTVKYNDKTVTPSVLENISSDGGDIQFAITVYNFETATFENDVKNLSVTPYVNYTVAE